MPTVILLDRSLSMAQLVAKNGARRFDIAKGIVLQLLEHLEVSSNSIYY